MTNLTQDQQNIVSIINQEIIDISGGNNKEAFEELMTANNPVNAIKHAYKMICKIRNLNINSYFLNL